MSKMTRCLALSLPFFAVVLATGCEPLEEPLDVMPLANGHYDMFVHEFEAIDCPDVIFDDEIFDTVFKTRLQAHEDRVSFDLEGITLEGRRDGNTISLAWNEGDQPVDVGTSQGGEVDEDAAVMFTVMPDRDVEHPGFRPDLGAKLTIVARNALEGSIFFEGPTGMDFCSVRLDVDLEFVGQDELYDPAAPQDDDEPIDECGNNPNMD